MEKGFVDMVDEDIKRLMYLIKYFNQFEQKPSSEFLTQIKKVTLIVYSFMAAILGLAFAFVMFKLVGMI